MAYASLPPEVRTAAERVLTRRQLTVLQAVLKGMSYREIGLALGIHEATVRGHYDAAKRKLEPYMTEAA